MFDDEIIKGELMKKNQYFRRKRFRTTDNHPMMRHDVSGRNKSFSLVVRFGNINLSLTRSKQRACKGGWKVPVEFHTLQAIEDMLLFSGLRHISIYNLLACFIVIK